MQREHGTRIRSKRGFYKQLRANMTVTISLYPVELIAWLKVEGQSIKYCEITSILFCEEREPTWVNVIKLIQMLFFGLWFFLF